jgi:hypothetical protein
MLIRKLTQIIPRSICSGRCFNRLLYSQLPKINPNKNYYDILGVPRDATDEQINISFTRLTHLYDPSINPAHRDKFNDIN